MKGIILAGGSGTRLYPLTEVTSKQLMPIYDKPMIYYPLSVLMQAEIRDILVISTPKDLPGVNLSYKEQPKPNGLAEAFILGKDFIGDDTCCMVLGDNIFYGPNLKKELLRAKDNASNGSATVFGYHVHDPERFGIVEFDKTGKVLSVEEKPANPKSNYAVTGLYFYDNTAVKKAATLKPSARGELEITDLNKLFLNENKLNVITLNEGYGWFDTGTFKSLFSATNFVATIQEHQNITICCPEEIAYKNGWLDKETVLKQAELMKKNTYGKHLLEIVKEK